MKIDTQGRESHDSRGRDWNDAATRRGTTRMIKCHLKLGRNKEGFFL